MTPNQSIAFSGFMCSLLIAAFAWCWHSLGAGILLSSRLGFTVAVAAIALQFGAISEAMNSTIILIAIISSTVVVVLFCNLHFSSPSVQYPESPYQVY